MRSEDFTPEMAGKLVRAPEGHLAFVPDPLPPEIPWDDELVARLAEAVHTTASLEQAARKLDSPFLVSGISQSFLRKEAQLSARIEGTQTTLADLYTAELFPEPETYSVREVINHIEAQRHGLDLLEKMPISKRMMLELHSVLMQNVRGMNAAAGEFRKITNRIGPPGSSVDEATFIPPPPVEMNESLNHLEDYINSDTNLHPLIHVALVHAQFETIHPFLDGNGRIGRLLIVLMLCAEKVLSSPLIYLSAYFENTREEYCRRLFDVNSKGKWYEWLLYFLVGIRDQARDAFNRCQLLQNLHDKYTAKYRLSGRSARTLRLIDSLFQNPYFKTRTAAKMLDAEYHTAQRHIDKLLKAGILIEITGQSRNRIFCAHEIMKAIDSE